MYKMSISEPRQTKNIIDKSKKIGIKKFKIGDQHCYAVFFDSSTVN